MSETTNISIVADKLSAELFHTFGWKKVGTTNINYPCITDSHTCKRKTHPVDVVFMYEHPYENREIYIHTDLKSYAIDSIDKTLITTSMRNMGQAIQCAKISEEYRRQYFSSCGKVDVTGLLFVYNHDNKAFDKLNRLADTIPDKDIIIPHNVKIFLMGPKEISFLAAINTDIGLAKGNGEIPIADGSYGFFYPHLTIHRVRDNIIPCATIEQLLSNWLTVSFVSQKTSRRNYFIYLSSNGESEEEFIYLFEYIWRFQLSNSKTDISIRAPSVSSHANANFHKALDRFFDYYYRHSTEEESIKTLKNTITFKKITTVIREFDTIEIGRGNETDN